jgi:hypothetical protein
VVEWPCPPATWPCAAAGSIGALRRNGDGPSAPHEPEPASRGREVFLSAGWLTCSTEAITADFLNRLFFDLKDI